MSVDGKKVACRFLSHQRLGILRRAVVGSVSLGAIFIATSALAETCQFDGAPRYGLDAPLIVDATCEDPDYNARTFMIDSVESKTFTDANGKDVTYREVKGHFPVIRTRDQLPEGVRNSPTLHRHNVTWQFPDKPYFRNRTLQHTYPLFDDLNTVEQAFAFANGAATIKAMGNPHVGYRVSAAATKLAKAYAQELYGTTAPIHSYLYGQSGGSVQAFGMAEGPTGVWSGIMPIVVSTTGLFIHSFQWAALYATAIPLEKRQAIHQAAEVGSGRSIYEGLDAEQKEILDEFLKAGFPRVGLGNSLHVDLPTGEVAVGDATVGTYLGPLPSVAGPGPVTGPGNEVRNFDLAYEDDFWTKPGYAGFAKPQYIQRAKVDGSATIAAIIRDANGVPKQIQFDPTTIPPLGSIGAAGLQFYVLDDAGNWIIDKTDPYNQVFSLRGMYEPTTGTLNLSVAANPIPAVGGTTSQVHLNALKEGGKVRINNRYFLAQTHYPRHSALTNGNPGYQQYKNADGSWKYPQRPYHEMLQSNYSTAGGIGETGNIKTKVMVMENLEDINSFPYTAGFYASQVRKALGKKKFEDNFRIYYQDHWGHDNGRKTNTAPNGGLVYGLFNQMLIDLMNWAERGIAPKPSTQFTIDSMTQVVLPQDAYTRKGIQPVINLTSDGDDRVEVGVAQPVLFTASIQMPPDTGEIFKFNWSVIAQAVSAGGLYQDFTEVDEPETVLASPNQSVTVNRHMVFPAPGEYVVRLNASGERNGQPGTATELKNFGEVRVVVR